MKDLANRLNHLLDLTGTTKTALAQAAEVSQASINDLCSGKSKSMKATTAIKVAQFFNVSFVWLVEGIGPMRSESVDPGPDVVQYVPLISWVQAGKFSGIEWTDDVQKFPTPKKMSEKSYCLRVRGESMLPKFEEGEIIFVDPERSAKNKDYVIACTTNEESTFKQLVSDGEIQYLRPLNKDWPGPQVIPLDQDTKIVGVVIGKWTAF